MRLKERQGRGDICIIPTMMQLYIPHKAHKTPASGHFGANGMYLCINGWDFWNLIRSNIQKYIASCDLCN